MTLLDSQFVDFVSIDNNIPADGPDRSGNPLPQAPDVSLNVGAKYSRFLSGGGMLTLSGGYRYQSSVFYNIYKDQATEQDVDSNLFDNKNRKKLWTQPYLDLPKYSRHG